jgi:hypothetical protein
MDMDTFCSETNIASLRAKLDRTQFRLPGA